MFYLITLARDCLENIKQGNLASFSKRRGYLVLVHSNFRRPTRKGQPPWWRTSCVVCSALMRKQLQFNSGADGLEKNHILKAPVNGCRTCVRNVLPVWLSEGCLSLPLCLSLFLCLCSCLSSSAFWKCMTVEWMAHKLLCKNSRMTIGLLKPLGHPNVHPIDVIDLPFC